MDYYNLLGVKRTARPEEIRTAFRRLAKRAHPDAHPHLTGEEKMAMHRQFIQLAHAYETLSDPGRRTAYDRDRRHGATPHRRAAPRGRTAPRAQRRPRSPPTAPPGESDDLDGLLQEVQGLLDKFGLNMRQQFGEMLDNALDWALSVFLEVAAALEKAEQETSKPQTPPRRKPSQDKEASTAAKPTPRRPPPNLDDELAALKQQVRSSGDRKRGRAPTSESVEEALQQIKERGRMKD